MKTYRLQSIKGKKDFDLVFKNAKKFFEKDAAAFVCYKSAEILAQVAGDDIINISYAVTVRKKMAKKAVVRNRIKRLLRVSFRQVFDEIAAKGQESAMSHIVIVWQNAPKHPGLINLDIVLPVARKLINRANNHYMKKVQE